MKHNVNTKPKYEFTGETKTLEKEDVDGKDIILHRIRRLADGKIGGWIQSEDNLSHEGLCWVDDEAMVMEGSVVKGNAQVFGHAVVSYMCQIADSAQVYGKARISCSRVYGKAKVGGQARIDLNTRIYGNARVFDTAYIQGHCHVFGNAKVYEHGMLANDTKIGGTTCVHGNAYLYECELDKGDYSKGEYYENLDHKTWHDASKEKIAEAKKQREIPFPELETGQNDISMEAGE